MTASKQRSIFKVLKHKEIDSKKDLLELICTFYPAISSIQKGSIVSRGQIIQYERVTTYRTEDYISTLEDFLVDVAHKKVQAEVEIESKEQPEKKVKKVVTVPKKQEIQKVHLTLPLSHIALSKELKLAKKSLISCLKPLSNPVSVANIDDLNAILRSKFAIEVVDKPLIQQTPYIVTILGHVDHGKTSLLKAIEQSTFSEEGGITQQIAAQSIHYKDKNFLYIDTPGHEAFSFMRSLGSKICDMALLILSAVDKVQPQTVEAIKYIKEKQIPAIVVITKTDITTEHIPQIFGQLADHGMLVEDLGGDVPVAQVSIKDQQSINNLLELLSLSSELYPSRVFDTDLGYIMEHGIYKKSLGKGYVVILRRGSIKVGDYIQIRQQITKVRMLYNLQGKAITAGSINSPFVIYSSDDIELSDYNEIHIIAPSDVKKRIKELHKTKGMDKHVTIQQHEKEDKICLALQSETEGKMKALVHAINMAFGDRVYICARDVGTLSTIQLEVAKESNALLVCYGQSQLVPVAKMKFIQHNIIYHLIDMIKQHVEEVEDDRYYQSVRCRFVAKASFNIGGQTIIGGVISKGYCTVGDELYHNKTVCIGHIKSIQIKGREVTRASEGEECGLAIETEKVISIGEVLDVIG